MATAGSERRGYFRIHSELALQIKPVDAYRVAHEPPENHFPEDRQQLDLVDQLKRLDRDANALLGPIADISHSLADYLSLLNRKVDAIAQQLLSNQPGQEDLADTRVNLSQGGLAFIHKKPLYKGSLLALQLRFANDYSTIACYAEVIRCDTNKHHQHTVACRFLQLPEHKQALIARQIMQAQREAKRREQAH